ncbi:MAG: DUF1150 domain-containing protein [Pseudomonadota bacterium]
MASPKGISMDFGAPDESISVRELAELGGRKLVYIRTVIARDVMHDITDEFGDAELDIEEDATLYSVHAASGERIALVGDRELAFAAARQHEMNPVSVH